MISTTAFMLCAAGEGQTAVPHADSDIAHERFRLGVAQERGWQAGRFGIDSPSPAPHRPRLDAGQGEACLDPV